MSDTQDNNPLVSVIVPTYNHAQFIAGAIESVLNQSYANWELIIIDNYSTDNTEAIVNSYLSGNRRIRYEKFSNGGVIARSRNHGIKITKGSHVAFLDSDDVWHRQKLEKQLPHFEMPKIIGVASNAALVADTPYYRKTNSVRSKRGYVDYKYRDILNYNHIVTSSLIVRREVLNRAGLFDEDKTFSCIEDWELWLRMARYGSFRVLESPLLTYFVSRKRGYQSFMISKNCLKILEKQVNLGYVKYEDIIEPNALIYLAIARSLLEFDQRQSRRYYIKALKSTTSIARKIKSCTGLLISFLPSYLRKIILLFLYKADSLFFNISRGVWSGIIQRL